MSVSRIPRPGGPLSPTPSPLPVPSGGPGSNELISPCGTSTIAFTSRHLPPTASAGRGSASTPSGPMRGVPGPASTGTRLPSLTVRPGEGGSIRSISPVTPPSLPTRLPSPHGNPYASGALPQQSQVPAQSQRRPRAPTDANSSPNRPIVRMGPDSSASSSASPTQRMVSGGWSGPATTPYNQNTQPRSCLRPPSTVNPSTGRNGDERSSPQNLLKPISTEPVGRRARAMSSAVDTRPPGSHTRLDQALGSQPPWSGSGGETRSGEPLTRDRSNTVSASTAPRRSSDMRPDFDLSSRLSVVSLAPPYIRIRLRLLHQLGSVLGLDEPAVGRIIDVPALLARVDAAYERAHARGLVAGMGVEGGGAQAQGGGRPVSMGMTASSSVAASGVPIPRVTGAGSGSGHATAEAMRTSRSGGVLNMIKRLGRKPSADALGSLSSSSFAPDLRDGAVFGVSLNDAPAGSWCTSLIGGQRHELPLVVFTVVEEIYRRGMSQPGIFRLAGDGARIGHLIKAFNMPPMYGDSLAISQEPIHNLAGLVKRYVRDLPEPLLDDALFPALVAFCAEPDSATSSPTLSLASSPTPSPDPAGLNGSPNNSVQGQQGGQPRHNTTPEARVAAAQIMLKLLPPLHFSLVIYLLAFLGQLPLFPDNRLNVDSISIIFGPALCAARGRGVAGLGSSGGPAKPSHGAGSAAGGVDTGGTRTASPDSESVSDLVNQSQSCLAWLLRNWGSISQKVLDPPEPEPSTTGANLLPPLSHFPSDALGLGSADDTSRLLSPIDLKEMTSEPHEGPVINKRHSMPSFLSGAGSGKRSTGGGSRDPERSRSGDSVGSGRTVLSDSAEVGSTMERSGTGQSVVSGNDAGEKEEGKGSRQPKRSASFTSLSGLVKKGGEIISRMDRRSSNLSPSRSFSNDKKERDRLKASTPSPTSTDSLFPPTPDDPIPGPPPVNPQITNVLGSLHDLLVSKDKQIERDAKELAVLRHTLLEMDERLRAATAVSTTASSASGSDGRASSPPPRITITSTPSSATLDSKDKERDKERDRQAVELRKELSSALTALEDVKEKLSQRDTRIAELEGALARVESERSLEVGKLQVALALEQAKVMGLTEERDLAKERLDKVKSTLFSVA